MSGRRSRTKGLSFEREIANALKKLWPDAKRHLEVQACEAQGYDLDHTEPFRIQCKRGARYAPISKLTEPIIPKDSGLMPMLITKGDRTRPVTVMYLDDFLKWTEEMKNTRS